MKKSELIKKFDLNKTNTKCVFTDGTSVKERTLYVGKNNKLYVFYGNDLHIVRPRKNNEYTDGMETLKGYIGAGYSWYH